MEPATVITDDPTASQPDDPLTGLVARATGLAEACGLGDEARGLGSAEPDTPACVVVVGESNRGKSSLVNALLGRPGLLPVAADTLSNVHVAVGWAPQERATAMLERADGPVTVDIPLAEVAAWATEDGNPSDHKGVLALQVGLPHPLLAGGLTLIDTPGVGGLEAGHAEVTLSSLVLADALVFVTDATAPISRIELDFIVAAAERVETVIFVVTKIDAHPGWAEIVAEDRALLAEHAPRFKDAPLIAVSTALESTAETVDDDVELAQRLVTESGVDVLRQILRTDVAERTRALRAQNRCRQVEALAGRVAAAEALRLRSATGDGRVEAELTAEQARCEAFTKATADWRQTLADEFERLRLDTALETQRHHRELGSRYQALIASGRPTLDRLPRDLADAVEGRWLYLTASVRRGTLVVTRRLAERFAVEGIDIGAYELALPERLRQAPGPVATSARPEPAWESPLWRFGPGVGAVAGGPLVTAPLVALFPPLALIAFPLYVGIVGAGFWAGRLLDEQRRAEATRLATEADATRFVTGFLDAARHEMTVELEKRLIDLRQSLGGELDGMLRRRGAELEAALALHRQLAVAAASGREPILAEARANVAEAGALATEAAHVRAELAPRPEATRPEDARHSHEEDPAA